MADSVDNYLGLSQDEIVSPNHEEFMSANSAENVLKDFRSLDCSVCAHHFGFQNRFDPHILVCSPNCLAVTTTKLKKCSSGQFRSRLTSPCPMTPLIRKFDHASLSESYCNGPMGHGMGHQHFVEDSASERWQGGNGASSCSSSRTMMNGPSVAKRDQGAGRDVFGTGRNISDGVGPRRSTDVPDCRGNAAQTNKAKESLSVPCSSAFKPIHVESHEDALQQARQNARISKPTAISGTHSVDAPPAPRPLRELNADRRNGSGSQVDKGQNVAKNTAPVKIEPAAVKLPEKKTWKIQDMTPSLKLVHQATCIVPFIWSCDRFTINASADAESLEKLDNEISSHCVKAPKMTTRTPEVDEIILAPYDGLYFRAKVDDLRGKTAKVTFVDYGDSRVVSIAECIEPSEKIMQSPMYGVNFKLNLNVDVPEDFGIPAEVESVKDEEITIECKSTEGYEWTGTILVGKKNVNEIVEKIITDAKKAAEPKPAAPSKSIAPPKSLAAVKPPLLTTIKVPTSVKPMTLIRPAATPAPQVTSPPAAAQSEKPSAQQTSPRPRNPFSGQPKPSPNKRYLHSMPTSPTLTSAAMVHVNFTWSAGKLTISAVKDDAQLDALQEIIQAYAKTAPGLNRKPDIDEVVVAPYEGVFYRGRVTAVNGDKLTLEFVDYGDAATVPYTDCKELNAEISDHPIYGTILLLPGVPEDAALPEGVNLPEEGQLQVVEEQPVGKRVGYKYGILWLGEDATWNDTVKEALGIPLD